MARFEWKNSLTTARATAMTESVVSITALPGALRA